MHPSADDAGPGRAATPGGGGDVAPGRGGARLERFADARIGYLAIPLVILAASAVVGNAFAPALLANHPLLLLGLNATTRHLILTSTSIDAGPYFAVALVRRSLEDPLLYLLGVRYGDVAVRWVGEHLGGDRALRFTQRNFRRFGWPLVALFPGGVVCVLAGASGMSFVGFVTVGLVGTLATIAAIRASGTALSGPVDAVMAVVAEHWIWLTLASVAATALWLAQKRRMRQGRPEPSPDGTGGPDLT